MVPQCVCVLALAALLLLGTSTVSRLQDLKGQKHQKAPQIPSQFSPGERFAMKEALKGEPGPLQPASPRYGVPLSWGPNPCRPTPSAEGPLLELERHHTPQTSTSPSPSTSCRGLGTSLLPQIWLLGDSGVPCLVRNLPQLPPPPLLPCLSPSLPPCFSLVLQYCNNFLRTSYFLRFHLFI